MYFKKLLVLFFMLVPSFGFGNEPHWSNGCGPCIGETCESSYLRKFSDLSITPSGASVCKKSAQKLIVDDWLSLLSKNEIGLGFKNKKPKLIQIHSFEKLKEVLEDVNIDFNEEAENNIKKFFTNGSNPIVMYSKTNSEVVIFLATSDGE